MQTDNRSVIYYSALYSEIADFLASAPTPQAIIDFHLSDDLQNRFEELVYLNKSGDIAEDERVEIEGFLRIDHLMRIVKIRALQQLQSP